MNVFLNLDIRGKRGSDFRSYILLLLGGVQALQVQEVSLQGILNLKDSPGEVFLRDLELVLQSVNALVQLLLDGVTSELMTYEVGNS